MMKKEYGKRLVVCGNNNADLDKKIIEIQKNEEIIETDFDDIFGLKVVVFYCK